MDFFRIVEKETAGKQVSLDVYPEFRITRSEDLMIRGKDFYAIWREDEGLWSTDEYDVQRLVDQELEAYDPVIQSFNTRVMYMRNFSTRSWLTFQTYTQHLPNSYHQLDEVLTFANTEVTKKDYRSKRLPYSLAEGSIAAWDELVSVLYNPDERAKIEWAIGAVVAGDARDIQKFLVFYGAPGTGKSTIMDIILALFDGYTAVFEAKSLAGNNNQFATEAFRANPLVAVQQDGDLSKIEDNTKLNSIISHDEMLINEKNKPTYRARVNAMLFMGSNSPVKISDAKSGLIRRLLDVHPTGTTIPYRHYKALTNQVKFELGAIAYHCREVYLSMGKDFYNSYRPVEMMLQTDVFYNFIEAHYDVFKEQDGTTLKQAYALYQVFCDETAVPHKLPQYKFREELRNYFDKFEDRAELPDGERVRSWYSGFSADRFKIQQVETQMAFSLVLDVKESIFDKEMADQPAQYAKTGDIPTTTWANCTTTLADLDTSRVHFVKVPLQHIVIDFDLTDENGNKSPERNLEAASQWPATYAEFSKSGGGIHLHYLYDGDVTELAREFEPGIEIKVYTGDQALRRKLSWCNNVPIATLNGGLPLKEKKVINSDAVKSEIGLRKLIARNLRKEIHPGTKPSIDFIHHILQDEYDRGTLTYDVTDMRQDILAFASRSTNQSLQCIKIVNDMRFQSKDTIAPKIADNPPYAKKVYFDVEVFPNLFIICWKVEGDTNVVKMINPTAQAVEEIMHLMLVGFNCRRYDNHIVYAASMGYTNEQLYNLSQKLISGSPNAYFGQAYNISYADIFDYASVKQSLKKWEIELGLKHDELGLDWDQPVPEELWDRVAEYCANDVIATEQVDIARNQDFIARQILAELSGLPVNATTQQHTSKIVFGEDRKPQKKFKYTNLAEMFPGYEYDKFKNKSSYREEDPSEGGYVYAEPGMYENVAEFDVASMHPTSIIQMEMFGEYTKNFADLYYARLAIKRRDFESARKMLDGRLAPFLVGGDDSDGHDTADALAYALKIVINIVYGLTSARFENMFKDPRNIDNIVAKRGALFMIDLKNEVQRMGYRVVHIKTDSIKVANADEKIAKFIMEFGAKYGYDFEADAVYGKMCLVNNAVFIAWVTEEKGKILAKPHWKAVGAQFQHPYVFKTLFSHEQIKFPSDLAETKQVAKGAIYIDYEGEETPMALAKNKKQFIGKTGSFIPVLPNTGGGALIRSNEGKDYAVTGTTGFRWMETEAVEKLNKKDTIDYSYYQKLVDAAVKHINEFGDFEWFIDG